MSLGERQVFGYLGQGGAIDVGERQPGAARRQELGRGVANPGGGAGECNLSSETLRENRNRPPPAIRKEY